MNKEDFISVFETTLLCANLDIIGLSLVDDSHGVNVSVVLDCGFGNISKEK